MKGAGAEVNWEQEGEISGGTSNKDILGITEKYYTSILKF
jgi:hypothetical protein